MAGEPIAPHLELRQSQSLVMTPQLQQAIKILQMNNTELNAFVAEELERNPLLEREDDGDTTETIPEESSQDDLDIDYDNNFTNDSYAEGSPSLNWGGAKNSAFADEQDWGMDSFADESVSLREHLASQINIDIKNPADRLIAIHLIDFLDDAGYLSLDDASLAEKMKIPEARITNVIAMLQGLQPLGVFARNLKECLAIQLKDKNRLDPAMQKLLDNLPMLAKREFKALERICGVDAEDLADMVREIQALDPKPAGGFESTTVQALVPDVLMREDKNGNWIVELNSDTLPKVLLNQSYIATINRANISKSDKKTANNYLTSANWLIKALHQRAETILKVASAIVSHQKDFFAKGIEYLRPLTLKEIAYAVEMHESTVSRVTSGKYMATPLGVFELKYFFNQALGATGMQSSGESHSATTVKYKIKDMINAEDPKDILSDEQIAYLLQRQGIAIARRTVAKYREALNIPTSAQRRRDKRIKSL